MITTEQPKQKTTIYRKTNEQGIYTIWDLDPKKTTYVIRKKGNKYYAQIKINGRQAAQSCPTLEEARAFRALAKTKGLESAQFQKVKFKDVMENFFKVKEGQITISTFEFYKAHCKYLEFFYEYSMRDILPSTIDKWLIHLKSPLLKKNFRSSRLSFKKELELLRQVFNHYKDYYDSTYPSPLAVRHKKDSVLDLAKYNEKQAENSRKFIPSDDLKSFLQVLAAEAKSNNIENILILSVALFQCRTGARIGEACALRFNDIDPTTKLVNISRTVQWSRWKERPSSISNITKNKSWRKVGISDDALKAIEYIFITYKRDPNDLIFSTDGNQIIPYRRIQYRYDKALKTAGLPWRSTHILRHSFATDFLRVTGGNYMALKELLGHSTIQMTERYGKILGETVKREYCNYNEALSKQNLSLNTEASFNLKMLPPTEKIKTVAGNGLEENQITIMKTNNCLEKLNYLKSEK